MFKGEVSGKGVAGRTLGVGRDEFERRQPAWDRSDGGPSAHGGEVAAGDWWGPDKKHWLKAASGR